MGMTIETTCAAPAFAASFAAAGRKGGTSRAWIAAVAPLDAEVSALLADYFAAPKRPALARTIRGIAVAQGSTRAAALANLERALEVEARYVDARALCSAPAGETCRAAEPADAVDGVRLDGDDFLALLAALQGGEIGAACA